MTYYKIENTLPQIPQELLLDPHEVLQTENHWRGELKTYSIHKTTPELAEFLQPHFDFKIQVWYQAMTTGMHVHRDQRPFAYNYLLCDGGQVATSWYDEDETTVLSSVIFPVETWHWLNTHIPHAISEPKRDQVRIALTLWEADA